MPQPLSEIIDELKDVYLLAGLDDQQLQHALNGAQRVRLDAGETLFSHGEPATRFYWLRSGLLKLTRLSAEGEEKVVELVRSGNTFGEAIMFMDRKIFPVNAEAIEASEVVGFDSKAFREMLAQSSTCCFSLLANLSQRLHHIVDEIDRLTLQNATARVIAFLLDEVDTADHVRLETPKHVIASRLSIQPETLSRIFARLGKEKLIRVEKGDITLLNVDALRRQLDMR